MLTPIDIQQKKFKSGFGYKKKDVDAFMSALIESYEYLYRDNIDLNDRMKNLTSSLNQYKAIEKSLQKALILAQSAAEDVKNTANSNAKMIEDEARKKAKDIICEARKELESVHGKTLAVASQLEVYKTQYRQIVKSQLELMDSEAFSVDVKKLDAYLPIEEGESQSIDFIERIEEENSLNAIQSALTKETETMLNAANQGEKNDSEEQFNEEFYSLIAEVMEEDDNE